jgi:AcrR family transcriptional regulator
MLRERTGSTSFVGIAHGSSAERGRAIEIRRPLVRWIRSEMSAGDRYASPLPVPALEQHLKLGLTTTSRSVPPPAPSPQSVATRMPNEEVPPMLRRGPLAAVSFSREGTPLEPALKAAFNLITHEAPTSAESTKKAGASAPQSTVRRKGARRAGADDSSGRETPSPKKKARSTPATKKRILEAATAEIAARGFDGASLRSIARAAGVQQAQLHRFFADEKTLHAEVVRKALATMTESARRLLAQMDVPRASRKGTRRRGPTEIRALAEGFIDFLLDLFAGNGVFLAILRHEARRDAGTREARSIVATRLAPVFDAIATRFDEMRSRGEVRKDVDARHLALSCVAMIAFPLQEPLAASIWPASWRSPEHLSERRRHVVEMVVAHALP